VFLFLLQPFLFLLKRNSEGGISSVEIGVRSPMNTTSAIRIPLLNYRGVTDWIGLPIFVDVYFLAVSVTGLPDVDYGFSSAFSIKVSVSSKIFWASRPLELPVSNPWVSICCVVGVSGFPLAILWGGYFFDVFVNYKTRPFYLVSELEFDPKPLDRTSLLEIFHPKETLHGHVFSDCSKPCGYL
jgi:hypothetical protein